MSSLRTQLCLKSCELVKDLAIVMGPAIDPFADYFLTTFIKLSAGTKKLILQASQLIVSIILANITYNHKLTTHIWTAMQDKNNNPRICASAWLKVLLEVHAETNKSAMEHGVGIENVEKCIRKGLTDPIPDVRTPMRDTYWTFASIWPDRAEGISGKLDVSGKKALEKANPKGEQQVSGRSSVMTMKNDTTTNAPSTAPSRNPLSGRVSVKKFAAEQRKKIEAVGPSGIHSGPMRGQQQQRAAVPSLKRLDPVPGMIRPVSPSSSTTKTTRTGSPPRKTMSTRTGSPPVSPKRKVMIPRPSPLHTINMNSPPTTSNRPATTRKLSVLEQLVHSEWRVRVEGIVTVACLLAKKEPPGHPPGGKLPTLPPLDTLGPTLQKLLNDPQVDVIHHLLAPEVIPEIAKIIPVDQIVPRLLLLSEMEDEEHVKDTLSSSLPALKQLFSDAEAADMLSRTLMSMGVSGVVPRKMSIGFFTTTQKRKIIHGIFLWMNELVERHHQCANEYFVDDVNYKQYIHRLVPMFTNTKTTSMNYIPLTTLLKSFRQINEDVFDKVLGTFERATVQELKRAWGQPVDEPDEAHIYEEKVVTVHEVLGDVKVGGLTAVTNSPLRSRIPVLSPPSSPRSSREFPSARERSHGNVDEDLTMIGLPHAKESKAVHMVKEDPLSTFTRDLKKSMTRYYCTD